MNIANAVDFLVKQAGTKVQWQRSTESQPLYVYLRRCKGKAAWPDQWESGAADGSAHVVIAPAEPICLKAGDLLYGDGVCYYMQEAQVYRWQGKAVYCRGTAIGSVDQREGQTWGT